MKKTIYTLALGALLLAGCSQEENLAIGEAVKMSFTAKVVPNSIQSRAGETQEISVNKMICAVFTSDGETELIRETVEVTQGKAIFEPTLLKGEQYNIVFWAYQGDEEGKNPFYDVTDLRAIKFTPTNNITQQKAEVFTYSAQDISTDTNDTEITLYRPLSQINIATLDWTVATESLGVTAINSELTIENYNNVYNALTCEYSQDNDDEDATATYTLNKTFPLSIKIADNEKKDCQVLASGFVFGGDGNVKCTLSITANETIKITTNQEIDNVPVGANKRTNIYTNWLTGELTYTVSLGDFDTEKDENLPFENSGNDNNE